MTTQQSKTADPKDRDKMVRQLSLVAYLMSAGGRRVSAETIRWNVEGYGDEQQSLEAFARRFFADREELRGIGIEICSERDEFGDCDVYWLPREHFFLPQVHFSADELAALHTCLHLLGGQFAYSRLLRLALQGLALGTGNKLDDPVTEHMAVNLLSSGYDEEVAARLSRIETAVSRRKSIVFEYRSMSRDAAMERRVDPYGLVVSRGDWYLVGRCHEQEDIRVFKVKRIRGRIRNASKKEHDFAPPADFELNRYLNLEPWQFGPLRGEAVLRFSPLMGWWAANNLSHSGSVTVGEDGAATFITEYADPGDLCSLALGLGRTVIVESPAELRARMRDSLAEVARLHEGDPPETVPAAGVEPLEAPGRLEGEAPQVEPEHFSQLARTVSYLIDKLAGADAAELPLSAVCEELGTDRQVLAKDMELLRLVNTGGGGYLIEAYVQGETLKVSAWPEGELLKQPVHLTPREARAMILAIDLVGSHLLAGRFESLDSAREKIIAAAGGTGELQTIPVEAGEKDDYAISRAVNRGLGEHLLVEIEYLSRDRESISARKVEPYLVNRTKNRWYLVAWCRERDALRTFRFEMIKSARVLDEHFTPRDIDLDPFLEDPMLPSGASGSRRAEIWFSPAVSRRVRELHPHAVPLEDGSLRCELPFFSDRWLIDEILRYQGSAVLLEPAGVRPDVADAARQLLKNYS